MKKSLVFIALCAAMSIDFVQAQPLLCDYCDSIDNYVLAYRRIGTTNQLALDGCFNVGGLPYYDVVVPETFEKDGVTYDITHAGLGSFWPAIGIATIYLPNSIRIIDDRAFVALDTLRRIDMGRFLDTIHTRAMSTSLPYLDTIVCRNPNPPVIEDESVFRGVSPDVVVIVPEGSRQRYASAFGWDRFWHYETMAGVDPVQPDNVDVIVGNGQIRLSRCGGAVVQISDVAGRVLASSRPADTYTFTAPKTGIYFVKVGTAQARKVVVAR